MINQKQVALRKSNGKKLRPLPTKERLEELFEYSDGRLIRKKAAGGRPVGEVCGYVMSGGYIFVGVDGIQYYAHRIVWKMFNDEEPPMIDHINQDKQDNRIENLRIVTQTENARNQKMSANNTSGQMGVRQLLPSGTWECYIGGAKNRVLLGYFKEFEHAVIARKAAEKALGYSPYHGS